MRFVEDEDRVLVVCREVGDVLGDGIEERGGCRARREAESEAELTIEVATASVAL